MSNNTLLHALCALCPRCAISAAEDGIACASCHSIEGEKHGSETAWTFPRCVACGLNFESCGCAQCVAIPIAPRPLCPSCLSTFHKVESVFRGIGRPLQQTAASVGVASITDAPTSPIGQAPVAQSSAGSGTDQPESSRDSHRGVVSDGTSPSQPRADQRGIETGRTFYVDFAEPPKAPSEPWPPVLNTQLELIRIVVVCSGSKLASCGHELFVGELVVHHQQAAGAFGDPPEEGANDSWYSAVTSCLDCSLEVARRPLHPAGEIWREDIESIAYDLADEHERDHDPECFSDSGEG